MKEFSKKKSNVTVNDIAKAVNISASTVSRALNNHPKISQKTKEKVWEAAKKLGYFPNIPAYMQKQKSNIVLILVDNLQKPASQDFIVSAQNKLTQKGFEPLIKFISKNEQGYFSIISTINTVEIIGIISLLEENKFTEEDYQLIIDLKLPLITFNKINSEIHHTNIIPDWYNGSYIATNHLITQGAKNLLLIVDKNENSIYDELKNGCETATSNSSCEFTILRCDSNKRSIQFEIDELLKRTPDIDGIICSNNLIALQSINYLKSKNIEVPTKIMLVSFGNEFTGMNSSFPRATTVEYSAENLGTIAAKELIKLAHHNPLEKKLIVEPVKLIIRDSSMPD